MNQQIKYFCELIRNVIHPEKESQLSEQVNWSYLVKLAKEHNLLPIFMEGAIKYSSYTARHDYEKEMAETLAMVGAQVRRTNAFLRIYEAFSKEGLYPIVVKGIICRRLYGNLADHRPSGDEDILIRPDEYWKAKEVLISNGYIPQFEVKTETQLEWLQEVSFIHPTEKLHIELHLNAMGRENEAHSRMSDYFVSVFNNYQEIEINGVQVRTMTHQEHLLFLVLHAFKHFLGGGFGIRQVIDILLYLNKNIDEIDFVQLHEILKEFKAERFFGDIIDIGNIYLGFTVSTMYNATCPQELLEDIILCGTFGNKTQAEETAAKATKLVTGNYLKNKRGNALLMLRHSVFPSRAYMVYQSPSLEEKPWLLPIEWIKRWIRFFKKNYNSDGNLAVESVKISQRRMKVLKKYDLV